MNIKTRLLDEMVQERMKNPITGFTSEGDFFAVSSNDSTLKIWSTNNGTLLSEWKPKGEDSDSGFCSMALSFVGKKRSKGRATCLVALGSDDGRIFAVDAFSGETKWRTTDSFPCGVSGLSFTNKGRSLRVVGDNGMVYEMNSETGELVGEFKASKKTISFLAFSQGEKYFSVSDGRLRVLNIETGKEVLKFSSDSGHFQQACMCDSAETVITLGSGEKHLQVWRLDKDAGTLSRGPTLSVKHTPLSFQCKVGRDEESGTAVLAVSKSGAFVWHLKTQSEEEEVSPTKITCKVEEDEMELQSSASVKRRGRVSIVATQLLDLCDGGVIKALVTYGSIDQPRFTVVNVSNPGDDVVIKVLEETKKADLHDLEFETKGSPKKNKKGSKKRAASDLDQPTSGDTVDVGNGEAEAEAEDGVLVDDDMNEPTMGEKLADLTIVDSDTVKSLDVKPPSADSINVLLKQALHADDRALLLECLYTQDDKVIANSISQLNPSHVLKLLQSLMSIIQSRGAILACALPWLKCLLLQHSSGIMSQKSSLVAMNSLYQLIEYRASTFQSALQLSTVLDMLYTGIVDDEVDESHSAIAPAIFEDKDSSEEEESEDEAMETDNDDNGGGEDSDGEAAFGGISDLEGDDLLSE